MARLITGLTPTREQALQERMMLQLSRKYESLFRREIARATRAIARESKDALVIHERRINDLLTRLYKDSFKMFGRRLLNSIVKHNKPDETKKDIPATPQFDLARKIWILTQAELKTTQIAGTTKTQADEIIQQALADSIEDGLSEIQAGKLLQSRISEKGGQLSRLRGRMISRTESHGSSAASTQMAAKSTRLPLKKEWIASGGERTRETHFIASGQTVDIDQPFSVGADLLMQPGDASGSPEEVINCFTGDTKVSFASCKKSIRSVYTGELITIETARGHKLTGTPNHPVLTDSGFISLGEVNHSTNLVCCDVDKGFKLVDFDVNYIPTKFEDLHNSTPVVGMVMRKAGAAVNLYGRIVDSNIDIVAPDLELRSAAEAPRVERLDKLSLKLPSFGEGFLLGGGLLHSGLMVKFWGHISHCFVGSTNLVDSLFFGHPRPFNEFAFGLSSFGDSFISKCDTYTIPSDSKFLADRVGTFTGSIKTANKIFIDKFNWSSIPRFTKNVFNKGDANPKIRSALGVALSSNTHIDNALSIIKSSHVNTYVYTLETDEGFYNSGGIIAQNCRCVAGYSL